MAEIDVRMEDNSAEVLKELNLATERALFAIGVKGVEGCVDKASEIDDVTGRPTVDTGRYRAGFGFITPKHGKMTSAKIRVNVVDEKTGKIKKKTVKRPITDNFSMQRADKDTVVIANNVEYAPYLEYGSGTKEGGHHARYIMKRGIESVLPDIEKQTKDIFEGKEVGVSVDFGSK